jgi:hypothetical protein
VRLHNFRAASARSRASEWGFAHFRSLDQVASLGWPDDVLEQWLYDHAGNDAFLADYAELDLSEIRWGLEIVPCQDFLVMPTGASDGDCIEEFAENPDHWIAVRNQGVHLGVKESWDVHGTWKRWPILIDRALLSHREPGLQVVEGRTRIGVLRGRHRQGAVVADRHLAWVGRSRRTSTNAPD